MNRNPRWGRVFPAVAEHIRPVFVAHPLPTAIDGKTRISVDGDPIGCARIAL
jgi:hypothetical protein